MINAPEIRRPAVPDRGNSENDRQGAGECAVHAPGRLKRADRRLGLARGGRSLLALGVCVA